MKFAAALAALAFITVIAASCTRRDYACNCFYADKYGNRTNTSTTVRGSKSTAQKACTTHQNTLKYANHSNVTCFLQ